MALHPDIEGFLELAEFGRLSGKSQPMHELTPDEARQQFEQTSQLLDTAPVGELTVTAVSIPARDGHLLCARLYAKPKSDSEPLPVLLYFHGVGTRCRGNRDCPPRNRHHGSTATPGAVRCPTAVWRKDVH